MTPARHAAHRSGPPLVPTGASGGQRRDPAAANPAASEGEHAIADAVKLHSVKAYRSGVTRLIYQPR